MLTKKSKYGLKAVLELAEEAGRGPVLVSELADRQRLPRKFLEAILLELKRHGLLQSKKGRGGGYFLSRKPADITVGQVIRVLDGPLALIPASVRRRMSASAWMRKRRPPGDERGARRDAPSTAPSGSERAGGARQAAYASKTAKAAAPRK